MSDRYTAAYLRDIKNVSVVKVGEDTNGEPYYALAIAVVSGGTTGGTIVSGTFNGAVSIADGDDVALGARANAVATDNTSAFSLISLTKRSLNHLSSIITSLAGGLPAALTAGGNLKVANQEAIPAGTNNIGDVDVLSGPTGASALQLQGNIAHDAVDSGNPLKIGGKAYAPDAGPSSVASGDRADVFLDLSGRVLVYLATKLDAVNDAVTATPVKSSTANTPAIVTATGNALTANASRKSWRIQNLGTNALFVRMGASASTTVFHIVLKGGVGADDGNGGIIEDDSWTGIISVDGTSPRFTVTELT